MANLKYYYSICAAYFNVHGQFTTHFSKHLHLKTSTTASQPANSSVICSFSANSSWVYSLLRISLTNFFESAMQNKIALEKPCVCLSGSLDMSTKRTMSAPLSYRTFLFLHPFLYPRCFHFYLCRVISFSKLIYFGS